MNESDATGLPNEHSDINAISTNELPTPLPKFQLFIIFLIQFAEPVTATVIYPFVNQLIRETGVIRGDERRTGYFAGIVESTYFLAEAITVFHWGWASDRFGRRSVLLFGPFGLALVMVGFGLSANFRTIVASRCLQGVFSGNMGVAKSVIAEITDASNMADAYAIMSLVWIFGSPTGTILGGILSRPAQTWPGTFGHFVFFHKHPYFLSCAVAGSIAFISGLVALFGLKETLPSAMAHGKTGKNSRSMARTNNKDINSSTSLLSSENAVNYDSTEINGQSSGCEYSPIESGAARPDLQQPSEVPASFRELLTPKVITTTSIYMFLTFNDMCGSVLLPLFHSTSISYGGTGLDPYHMGVIIAAWGVTNAFVQIMFLKWTMKMLGPRTALIVGQSSYVAIFGLYPLLKYFIQRSGGLDTNARAVLVVQLLFHMLGAMAYVSIQIFITESAPNRASLAGTNGLAQATASVMRCIAPSIASSLFSLSLERHLLGGNAVFFILLGIAFMGVRVSFLLPKHA